MKKNSISLIFDFRHCAPCPDDVGTVSVYTYKNGRQQILSTGVRCRRCEWSPTRWVVGRPDADRLNAKLKEALDNAQAVKTTRLHSLRNSATLLDWMSREIDRQHLAPDTLHRHRQMLRELEAFGRIRSFRDVNARNIEDFMAMIARRTTQKVVNGKLVSVPLRQTAVYTYYRRLVKWVHLAQAQGLVPMNALAGVRIARGEYAQREHLTEDEVKQWINAALQYPHLIKARDLFAVQAGTGLAYVDLMEVDFSRMEKSGEFWTLTGVRHKTGKPYFIVVLPWAKEVIDRYGGKLPHISNQKYNSYLKEVAAYAHIYKKISSHVGRHTYACLCLSAGVRIEAVQRTLGHTDIKTTQIYAKLADQDVLAAFRAAYAE